MKRIMASSLVLMDLLLWNLKKSFQKFMVFYFKILSQYKNLNNVGWIMGVSLLNSQIIKATFIIYC